MTDKTLREAVEKFREDYDEACNDLISSTPNGSARDVEVRRFLEAFTDFYEAILAADNPLIEKLPKSITPEVLVEAMGGKRAATADAPEGPWEVHESPNLPDQITIVNGKNNCLYMARRVFGLAQANAVRDALNRLDTQQEEG